MSVESAVQQGRAAAELVMTDTFTTYSPAGTTSNASGQEVPAFATEYETPGKVSGPSAQARDTQTRYVSVGGVERPVIEGGLHIPVGAGLPAIGWEFVCTETGPASDPGLEGRRYRVVDVPLKSFASARRLDVVDVTP